MTSVKRFRPLRAEQANETRRRILEAAGRVFEQRGFAGARVDDVAAEAGVATPTVYKAFANKANLLVGAVTMTIAGDLSGSIDEQAWFTEQLDEPDPDQQLQLVARNARRMYERAGRLLNVLRAASPLDPELGRAWQEIARQRIDRSRRTAQSLAAKSGDRFRLRQDDAVATLVALTEPEVFTTYMAAGRSAAQYEAWLGDVLRRTLLD